MISLLVPHGGNNCTVVIDQGKITVTGPRTTLNREVNTLAKIAQERVGCSPSDGDPDFNAAMALVKRLGGEIVAYEPPEPPEPGIVY